jgi:hypothetical protein
MQKLRPDAAWVFQKRWWFARDKAGYKLVRAKPSKNLLLIRVRKNLDRPRSSKELVWDNWIADSPESTVRDEQQLSRIFKEKSGHRP